ncbi:terminase family protein, partial [Campylobacter upsaliensis]|uniref:terminase large subunit domain-containing protein n=1 Tax=Campylobacter upsaliensis TaxID=28080 RepID=UPI00214A742B
EFSNPPLKRVMLNMPPSYGKTETIARTFIPWALGNNPYRKFIYISYSDDLGRKINKQIRELMHSQFYRSIFSAPLFIQANSSEFILKQGGGLFVTTLKGAITGFHADSILIDDPIKVENMKSKKEREFVNQAFKDSILTRLQDKDSNITILMQRLGEDDLCGFLLNERHFSSEIIKEWKVLKMEALNKEKTLYNIGKFSYEREANEALFIKKHDLEGLKALKAQMGDDEFFTQYQQEPQASESGFFLLENFKTIPSFEMKEQKEYIFFDGAFAINARADNRALVVVGVENHGENSVRYVLKNCFYGVWDE